MNTSPSRLCSKCGRASTWSSQLGRVKLHETIRVLIETKGELLLTHTDGMLDKAVRRLAKVV